MREEKFTTIPPSAGRSAKPPRRVVHGPDTPPVRVVHGPVSRCIRGVRGPVSASRSLVHGPDTRRGCLVAALGTLCALIALLAPFSARAQKTEDRGQTFAFLHFSGSSQTADGADALAPYAAQFAAAPEKPAFVIATGNLTADGQEAEYRRVRQSVGAFTGAGVGFYAVPGVQDVRRSPSGKNGFVSLFGKTYQAFDKGGTHFILLDTTVLLQSPGHFDRAELDFLAKDLKRVKPETPILLFTHHAIGREGPQTRPVDNEFEFWPLFQKHNLIAAFYDGSGEDRIGRYNGVPILATRGLARGVYHRVSVTPLTITIERVTAGGEKTEKNKKNNAEQAETLFKIPVRSRLDKSNLLAGWNDPDVPFLARRRPTAKLEPRALADNPENEQGDYRVDSGEWKLLTRDARDYWSDQFLTKDIPVGIHTAAIRVTTGRGTILSRELIFEVERDAAEPNRRWAYNVDGPIQSSPAIDNDAVYVASNDGKITALLAGTNDQRGKKKWDIKTKGAVVASPILVGGTLYVGSTDGVFYAVDLANGKIRWRYDAGSPIFATAAAAQGIVCFGANGRIIGLDAATGSPKWTHPAGGFFQSAAATDGDSFYLGGWDNTLYALNAATGLPRWTAKIGRGADSKFAVPFSPAVASPCVAGGRVTVAGLDGVLYALDAKAGTPLWQIRAPQGGDPFGQSGAASINGLTFYVAGAGAAGTVYAIDGLTGRILWRSALGQPIYGSSPRLSLDGKSLAIAGYRGRVAVLETGAGGKLWTYELGPGNVFSTPGYDGRDVYTVTMENDIQAINAPAAGEPARRTAPKKIGRAANFSPL